MDATLKAKWVAALRSGKYKQGKGYLQRTPGKFCCLGVLCNVIDPAGWKGLKYDGRAATLPDSVQEMCGINEVCSFTMSNDVPTDGATMNDNWGWTFDQIATAIEESSL